MIIWGSPFGNESFQEKVPLVKDLSATNDSLWLLLQDGSLHRYHETDDRSSDNVKDVTDMCANGKQIFSIVNGGNLFALGSSNDDEGGPSQEGLGRPAGVWLPLLQSPKSMVIVVQVACGHSHTLMLAKYGDMYSMGDNSHGQLGLRKKDATVGPTPQVIDSLEAVPIRQIAAGSWHSFCITESGRVFVWGRNDFGQLGLGISTLKRSAPTLLKSFTDNAAAFISAGEFHTALLTKKGTLFTFGLGSHGQLGHGDTCSNELAPKQVQELEDSTVTQVSCGRHHTIAFVPGCAQIFVFGSNEEGQLGSYLEKKKTTEPVMANGPWQHQDGAVVKRIYAIGDRSFILLATSDEKSSDYRLMESDRQIATLNENLCTKMETCDKDTEVLETLRSVFHSQSCLNGSFSLTDRLVTNDFHDIGLSKASEVISRLCRSDNPKVKKIILRVLRYLIRKLSSDPPDIEVLRLYILLPMVIHSLMPPSVFDWRSTEPVEPPEGEAVFATKCLKQAFIPFLWKFLNLSDNPRIVLQKWYKALDQQTFSVILGISKFSIMNILTTEGTFEKSLGHDLPLKFVEKLDFRNKVCKVVRYKEFYLPRLPDQLLHDHFKIWKQKSAPGAMPSLFAFPFPRDARAKNEMTSLYDYPFLLDARAKNLLQKFNSKLRFNSPHRNVMQIDRNNVVFDVITQLNLNPDFKNLQRPLWAEQHGGGYDGALWKDIFALFFKEIMIQTQPEFNVFKEDETSKLLWFTGQPGSEENCKAIGKMLGMALYNDIIVDLNFPLALYKKLLGKEPNFDDFREINHEIGNSLRKILDFKEVEKTVEDVFCMAFITPDGIPLKKGGEDIPVTADNREEYVELYLDYFFNKSIQSQFGAFHEGFWEACDREILKLFRPEELVEMINGIGVYEWEDLKKATDYVLDYNGRLYPDCESGRFDTGHPVIKWFWEVLLSFSKEEKTKFLVFLTGSIKIPLTGLHMNILRVNECDEWMPYANVCSNTLHLHSYSSKEILEERLKSAVQGFHMK